MKITRQENKYMLIYISVKKVCLSANQYADVAELVDAPDSKSKWIFKYINPINIENTNV